MAEKRSIFEDVGSDSSPPATPQGGLIDRATGSRRAVRIWMIILFIMVEEIIVVGGLTRLTDSGLSITVWDPILGALPPFTQADWDHAFALYKEIPEYQLQNKGMSLSEFKFIYWWEWAHRNVGRAIGLVWFLGFMWLWLTRRFPSGWVLPGLLLGALGGLQGAVGWWMVSSGLTGTMLDVASYRLAMHLGLAFTILGVISWFVLKLGYSQAELMQARRAREPKLKSLSTGLMHFAFLQILLGALVAGIDAGRTYTDWPLMAGGFFPPYPFDIEPVWRNFFENAGLVQFIHRMAGYLLMVFGVVAWMKSRQSGHAPTRRAFTMVLVMMGVQMVLGIVTVMTGSPWYTAIVHQFGAVILFALIIRARFKSMYPEMQSVRG
ncbi:MAG: heme A synthase [Brevirhabdus sp.]